jgi:hypothetical protein
MGLFRKRVDPMSDRARALNSEIAALEAQIRKCETRLERAPEAPSPVASVPRSPAPATELELEEIGSRQLTADPELERDIVHVNEYGVQKYDLPGLISKVRGFFRAPTTSNPKLVNYLAAGGIQGLRPLRYEKRVARNRFIVFALILLVLLIGLLTVFVPR